MFKKKKKQILDSKVKYERPHFKQQLARARTYKRANPGSFAATAGKWLFWAKQIPWRALLAAVLVLAAAIYISFIDNIFFVRNIEVQGGTEKVQGEVRATVSRYLGGVNFIFPKRNLLFTPTSDLAETILASNFHVWRVEKVRKRWPNTLTISFVPREPKFLWNDGAGNQALIANDGAVLPLNERGSEVLLALAGKLAHTPRVGEQFISMEIVQSLSAIQEEFVQVTGLPAPLVVELVPVVAAKNNVPQSSVSTGAVEVPLILSVLPEPVAELLDVPPKELRLYAPGSPALGTAPLVVFFDVSTTKQAMAQLQLLLSEQDAGRRASLAYIDLRFINKAFICLATAPCAKDTPPVPLLSAKP